MLNLKKPGSSSVGSSHVVKQDYFDETCSKLKYNNIVLLSSTE